MLVDQLRRRVEELAAEEWLPPDVIVARQHEALMTNAQHHCTQTPAFAARLAAAGLMPTDLADPAALRRLPPLSRRALQLAGEDCNARAVPPEHGATHENRTSGSTGEPVRVRRTERDRIDWMAATMRDHRWWQRDLTGRLASIMRLPGLSTSPDWGAPAALLTRTGPAIGVPMTTPLDLQLAMLRDFAPTSLIVYPSNLAGLLDLIEADGAGLASLRELRSVSSTLTPELRARARRLLGVEIADIYSTEECGYLALQCPMGGGYHVMAENQIVEIVDEDGSSVAPGEFGRVLVTDLRNTATALFRYAIGDWAVAGAPCPCGRGLPTIARIVGRTRNLLTHPDGGRSWPYLASIDHRGIAGVVQYQYVQHDRTLIEVRLVTERALTGRDEDRLAEAIRDALGFPFRIDFTYSDGRLEPGPGHKFEEFINRIDPP